MGPDGRPLYIGGLAGQPVGAFIYYDHKYKHQQDNVLLFCSKKNKQTQTLYGLHFLTG